MHKKGVEAQILKKNHARKKWEDSWIYRHKGEGVPRGHEGKIN